MWIITCVLEACIVYPTTKRLVYADAVFSAVWAVEVVINGEYKSVCSAVLFFCSLFPHFLMSALSLVHVLVLCVLSGVSCDGGRLRYFSSLVRQSLCLVAGGMLLLTLTAQLPLHRTSAAWLIFQLCGTRQFVADQNSPANGLLLSRSDVCCVVMNIVTASVVQSASCVFSSVMWAIFRFLPHRGVKFGVANSTLISARMGWLWAPTNWKFYQFFHMLEYKWLPAAHLLHDFNEIFRSYVGSLGEIWGDSLKQLQSYGGLDLRGSSYSQIFSAPSDETMSYRKTFSRCKNMLDVLHRHAKFGMAGTRHPAGHAKNVEFCLLPPALHETWGGNFEVFRPAVATRCTDGYGSFQILGAP